MAALGGLFGGGKSGKHPHFDALAEAIQRNFALKLAPATPEVLTALDALTSRQLIDFDNAHSTEGLQELFRVRSIRMTVDPETHTVNLLVMAAAQVEDELQAEHAQVRTIHVGAHQATTMIIKPAAAALIADAHSNKPAVAAAVAALPLSFEHLSSVEALCNDIADVFVKYGQLTSADKDVLRKIKPINTTVEARIVALERWETELRRRVRAIAVPKAAPRVSLDADHVEEQPKTEEELTRRFETIVACSSDGEGADPKQLARRLDAFIAWVARLIREFETTGVRYRNKPVWLH